VSALGRISRGICLSARTALDGLRFVLSGKNSLAVRESRDRFVAVVQRLDQQNLRISTEVERLDRQNLRMTEVVERLGQLDLRIATVVERLDQLNLRMEGASQRIDEIVSRIDAVTGDALPLLRDELAFFENWLREESYRLEQLRRDAGTHRAAGRLLTAEAIPRILATLETKLSALRGASRVDFTSDVVPDADLISAAREHLGKRLATRLAGEDPRWDVWVHVAPGRRERRPRLLAEAVERLRADGLFVLIMPAPAEDLGGNQRLRLLPIVDLTGTAALPLVAAVWQKL
jgi:hypothetical protein